jgi:hypothetical protein
MAPQILASYTATSGPPWHGENSVKTEGAKRKGVVVLTHNAMTHSAEPCMYGAKGCGAVIQNISRASLFLSQTSSSSFVRCHPRVQRSRPRRRAGREGPRRAGGQPPPLSGLPAASPASSARRAAPPVRRRPDPTSGELPTAGAALPSVGQGENPPLSFFFDLVGLVAH